MKDEVEASILEEGTGGESKDMGSSAGILTGELPTGSDPKFN